METQRIRDSIIDGSFDLNSTTVDGLQFVLKIAHEELSPYIRWEQYIKSKSDKLNTVKGRFYRKLGGFGLCTLIGLLYLFFAFWGELSGRDRPIVLFITLFLVGSFYYVSQRKMSGKIRRLKKGLSVLKMEQEGIVDNFLLLLLIPYQYRNTHAISKMLEYVQNREASTWEHCIDLYKTEISRSEQLKLDQQKAEESARQREPEEKQLRAQCATAITSIISAAGILKS